MQTLNREPHRGRGCHKRFYVFIPCEKAEIEDIGPEETATEVTEASVAERSVIVRRV